MATFSPRRACQPHTKLDLDESDSTSSGNSSSTASPSPLLYTLLPSLVQRRMIPGRLRSLKQALSNHYEIPSITPAPSKTRHIRLPSVESITRPPSYQSHASDVGERGGRRRRPGSSSASSSGSSSSSRPSSSGSITPAIHHYHLEQEDDEGEDRSGVNWRYARPGISLLSLSSHEATSPPSLMDQEEKRMKFARRQYIDGVACILRGLPSNLTVEEELCVREALPLSISLSNAEEMVDEHLISQSGRGSGGLSKNRTSPIRVSSQQPHQPTLLHRITASLTLTLFLLISFLTPYIHHLLKRTYQLDRKYQLSERALAQSVVVVDVLGRQMISGMRSVCGWNEGFVGEVVGEVGVYLIQGFGGGVYEGFGEGMRREGLEWVRGKES